MLVRERILNGSIIFLILLSILGGLLYWKRWNEWRNSTSEVQIVKETKEIYKRKLLINLNTASITELQRIPGIGPKTAEKILKCRDSLNGFKKIEDVLCVKGIGKKKFEKMRSYIYVK